MDAEKPREQICTNSTFHYDHFSRLINLTFECACFHFVCGTYTTPKTIFQVHSRTEESEIVQTASEFGFEVIENNSYQIETGNNNLN